MVSVVAGVALALLMAAINQAAEHGAGVLGGGVGVPPPQAVNTRISDNRYTKYGSFILFVDILSPCTVL